MLEGLTISAGFIDILDILIVAILFYWLMVLVRGTRAERMLIGLAIVVLVFFISQRVELFTLHWILSNFLSSIVIIIIVVFQQDIRRALVQMGSPLSSTRDLLVPSAFLKQIWDAVSAMSAARTGALIVVERSLEIRDFLDSGTQLDAIVSSELILTLFNDTSALHDGAILIRDGRIVKAGCILPLTEKELTQNMGTRHRAAMGLAELTDAVVIVVSEKTGDVSLVVEERIETGPDPKVLFARLKEIFTAGKKAPRKGFPWKNRA